MIMLSITMKKRINPEKHLSEKDSSPSLVVPDQLRKMDILDERLSPIGPWNPSENNTGTIQSAKKTFSITSMVYSTLQSTELGMKTIFGKCSHGFRSFRISGDSQKPAGNWLIGIWITKRWILGFWKRRRRKT